MRPVSPASLLHRLAPFDGSSPPDGDLGHLHASHRGGREVAGDQRAPLLRYLVKSVAQPLELAADMDVQHRHLRGIGNDIDPVDASERYPDLARLAHE